jgi:hypothetical protein
MGRAKRNPSLLAKISSIIAAAVARPVVGINAERHHAMEGRIGPILDLRDMAVFHRIEVNVVDVTLKVALIAQRMLPKSALPNSPLAFAVPALRDLLMSWHAASEHRLDQAPARREIRVAFGQCPYRVQMIGQHDRCFGCERVPSSRIVECATQQFNIVREQLRPAVNQIDGEEIAAAGQKITSIIRHRHTDKDTRVRWVSLCSTHPTLHRYYV